jgi:WD40 repeat protein
MPSNEDQFLECSEDLTLRLWDIRQKLFKPAVEFKVGANFATNCDVLSGKESDHYLATGHRGFNNAGAEVKLWDLRAFKDESALVFTYDKHRFSPEAVRFLASDVLISASKDQSVHLIDIEGNQCDVFEHNESFAGLAVLRERSGVIVADVQSSIFNLNVDAEKKHFDF